MERFLKGVGNDGLVVLVLVVALLLVYIDDYNKFPLG